MNNIAPICQPCADQPCADQPCADQPCADQPCADQPCADQPCADQPCADQPCADQPYYDEYGFPLDNFAEPVIVKPKVKRCSHCRSPYHTRNNCIAYHYSELVCESNDSKYPVLCSSIHSNNKDNPCFCMNCYNYREWNCPNPVASRYIFKKTHPGVAVNNHSDKTLYVYKINRDVNLVKKTFIPGNSIKEIKIRIPYSSRKWLKYEYYITWEDKGEKLHKNDICKDDIAEFIILEYGGGMYDIDIYGDDNVKDWKRAALKSRYLLDQLVRLGAKSNENYEPILDLIEDIEFPHVREIDKEDAGIPSEFTNIS